LFLDLTASHRLKKAAQDDATPSDAAGESVSMKQKLLGSFRQTAPTTTPTTATATTTITTTTISTKASVVPVRLTQAEMIEKLRALLD
jgi:hypothetical protein